MSALAWRGDEAESRALVEAANRNCACTFDILGQRLTACAAHGLLLDQRSLDGLLFWHRFEDRLSASEWDGEPVPAEHYP